MKQKYARYLGVLLCLMLALCLIPAKSNAVSNSKRPTLGNGYDLKGTSQGDISWLYTGTVDASGSTWFEIKLYRNNETEPCLQQWCGWNSDYLANGNRATFELRGFSGFEWKSGTYCFTIQTFDRYNGVYDRGEIVTSGTWNYTVPKTRMEKPTNLRWDFPYIRWDSKETKAKDFNYILYRSDTKDGDLKWMGDGWRVSETYKYLEVLANGNKPYPGYYYVKVRTVSKDITKYNNSEYVLSEPYCVRPDTPKVKAVNVASTGKPKLSWNWVTYAQYYQVYRSDSKTGDYKLLDETSSNSFTDSTAKAGKTYYYKVRAVCENEIKSSYSSPVARTCDLARPKVEAQNTASSGKVKLTWKAVSGAKSYTVFRATSEKGEYKELKTTENTDYTDSSAKVGKIYYYRVRANHAKSGSNSAQSSVVSESRNLARPAVTMKLKSNGDPRLSWKKISGATKYYVYRATSKNGEYTKIATVEKEKTAYADTKAKAGKTYYYKVKAIKSGANSAYSTVDKIKAK